MMESSTELEIKLKNTKFCELKKDYETIKNVIHSILEMSDNNSIYVFLIEKLGDIVCSMHYNSTIPSQIQETIILSNYVKQQMNNYVDKDWDRGWQCLYGRLKDIY